MCDHSTPTTTPASTSSSRRRRLWELAGNCHCPILGVCVPLPMLRKLVGKVVKGQVLADDYELHCGVIAECRQRGKVAELLQKELEQRYALSIRQAGTLKCTDELRQWWQTRTTAGTDIPGTLWATLSHSRCDAVLEEKVLRDIHMIQHQAGAAERVDMTHHRELVREHAVLVRELATIQERITRLVADKAAQQEALAADTMRLRSALIGKDTLIASLESELQSLRESVPDLKPRQSLQSQLDNQLERNAQLQRQLLAAEQQNRILADRVAQLTEQTETSMDTDTSLNRHPTIIPLHPVLPAERLKDKAILCVGGRAGSIPVYRRLIEETGAQFLHHDGGDEDSSALLDANLAAADLVICQTGCVSHNAYWRVKDHCKRTGKQCVFVDKPSASSLARRLTHAIPE
ncbi:DUF2325 domain-containing protein [Aquabacterium sp.]|uniref:DUF2325 domain-containing protein n=1 Tax=Aquabacterium sp. TaxID=1872578 RepID=UPI0035B34789